MNYERPGYELFLTQIAGHTGLAAAECESAARAVLVVLGTMLPDALGKDVRASLPPPLDQALGPRAAASAPAGVDAFFTAIAEAEDLPVGFAKEHAGVVCQSLVEFLSAETLSRLVSALGPELGALFRRRERPISPARPLHDKRETLSSGRPGGEHPLSEAGDEGRQDTLASGRAGGERPVSEAHPGHREEHS